MAAATGTIAISSGGSSFDSASYPRFTLGDGTNTLTFVIDNDARGLKLTGGGDASGFSGSGDLPLEDSQRTRLVVPTFDEADGAKKALLAWVPTDYGNLTSTWNSVTANDGTAGLLAITSRPHYVIRDTSGNEIKIGFGNSNATALTNEGAVLIAKYGSSGSPRYWVYRESSSSRNYFIRTVNSGSNRWKLNMAFYACIKHAYNNSLIDVDAKGITTSGTLEDASSVANDTYTSSEIYGVLLQAKTAGFAGNACSMTFKDPSDDIGASALKYASWGYDEYLAGSGMASVTRHSTSPTDASFWHGAEDSKIYFRQGTVAGSGSDASLSAANIAEAIKEMINASVLGITATRDGTTVSLTNDTDGSVGNVTTTTSNAGSLFSVTGMAVSSGGSTAMARRLQISARQIAISGSGGLSGSADAKSALVLDLAGLSAASIAQTDVLAFADADSSNLPKKITFSDFEDAVFGNVSGDATIAAGGALTIASDAVESGMLNDNVISGQTALGSAAAAQADELLFSDAGTLKKITFSNLEDSIFGNVSGDIAVAAGGAATIQADAVESGMLNDNVISGQSELASDGLAAADEMLISDGGTLKKIGVDNLMKDGLGLLSAASIDVGADHMVFLDGGATGDAKVESMADIATAMAGTGLAASSGVIGVDGVLEDLDTLGAASADGEFIVATGAGAFAYESGNTARTSLGLGTGDSPQFTGLTLTGDLTVGGTTTTVNSTVVAIADKAMVFASGSTNSQIASAGGAGINIGGEGGAELASFLYDGVDSWDMSDHLNMASGQVIKMNGADMLSSSGSAKVTSDVAGNGLAHSAGVLSLDLDELSAASVDVANDSIAIIDANDSNGSKKESIADLMTAAAGTGIAASSGVLALDASELSDAAVASGDKFVFHDATDDSTKKESIDDIATFMAGDGLDASSGVLAVQVSGAVRIVSDTVAISGSIAGDGLAFGGNADSIASLALDISEYSDVAVASGDKFLMLDSDGNTHQLESIDDISSFQAGAGLAATSGVLAVVNASNGGLSVNANDVNLDLNDLSAAAVDVGADSIAIIDATDNSTKKESIADLATGMAGDGLSASSGVLAVDFNEISAADVDASADSFLFVDATDNSTKKESLADYATAIAGDGIAASSGVLSVGVDDSTVELSSDAVRVKAQGIAASHLGAVAGDGLQGGSGTALSVKSIEDRFTGSDVAVSGTIGTLSQTPATTGSVFVFVNGMMQSQDHDYTLSGTGNKTLAVAGANNLVAADEVIVKYIQA